MNTDAGLMQLMTMADWVSQLAPPTEEENAMREELWQNVLEHIREKGKSRLNASELMVTSYINESPPNAAEHSAGGHRFPLDYYLACQSSEREGSDSEKAEYLVAEDRHPAAETKGFWNRDENRLQSCIISGIKISTN